MARGVLARSVFGLGAGLLVALVLAACAPRAGGTGAEPNAAGDIPDTQAFVTYRSGPGGYVLEVPEGWPRTERGPEVRFVEKLGGVQVAVSDAAVAPTAAGIRAGIAATPAPNVPVSALKTVQDVTLPGGPAVLVTYASTSDPDAVTGKQIPLDDVTYLFYTNRKLATLTLWAPAGADNADQWQRIARSFRWQ